MWRAGGVHYKGTVRAVLREPPGPHMPPPERALYDPWDSVEVRSISRTSCMLKSHIPCTIVLFSDSADLSHRRVQLRGTARARRRRRCSG